MSLMDFVQLDSRKYPGLSGLACACQGQNMGTPSTTTTVERPVGMGAISQVGPGVFRDDLTGRTVVAYGNGTFVDPSTGEVLDQSGVVVSRQAGSVSEDSGVVDTIVSGTRSIASVVPGILPLIPVRGAYRAPAPPPSQGPGLGTVLFLGALGGLGIYAATRKS